MTTPTSNPVPSNNPNDLLFNAEQFDVALNSAAASYTDRLGVVRRTVKGQFDAVDAELAEKLDDAQSQINVKVDEAAASAADAADSALEALGYLQTYRATSYGALASDPATDPLGNPPTVGDEYFNTTANLLKRFNGTTWQASDINTANLAAPSGSSLVGYDGKTVQSKLRSMQVKTIIDMLALSYAKFGQNDQVSVAEYHAGTGVGGGTFYWDATRNRNTHDGGVVIDPTKALPSDWSTASDDDITAWFTATNTGTGCFVRSYEGIESGFWGSLRDAQALQAAFSFCYKNPADRSVLRLTVSYDITGYSIKLPSSNWVDPISVFGGQIKKSDAGFMFTRDVSNRSIDAPSFTRTKFYGSSGAVVVYVFDGNTSIRHEFNGCRFNRISAVNGGTGYTQSVRVQSNCVVYNQPAPFIKAKEHYDLRVHGNSFEISQHPLLWAVDELGIGGAASVTSSVINNNLIEGYGTEYPIVVSSCNGLAISDNYTEANAAFINFKKAPGSGLAYLNGLKVESNFIGVGSTPGKDYDIYCEAGISYTKASISGNTTNRLLGNGIAMTNMTTNPELSNKFLSNYNYSNGKIFPVGQKITDTIRKAASSVATVFSEISSGSGLKITFKNVFRDDLPMSEYVGRNFLLSAYSTYGSSTFYRASFVGVVSIIGVWNGTTVVGKILVKPITAYGIDGSIAGAEGSGVSVEFETSGTVEADLGAGGTGIVVKFPNLKYNAALELCNASLKPIEDILLGTSFRFPAVTQ